MTDPPEEYTEYFRVRRMAGVWGLEVMVIEWDGPYTPREAWHLYERWASEPSAAEIRQVIERALYDPRFFQLCTICQQRCNVGHMHTDEICQTCAETRLGVVH